MALNEFLQIQNNTDIIFTSKKDSNNSQEKNQVVCIFAVLCFTLVYGI